MPNKSPRAIIYPHPFGVDSLRDNKRATSAGGVFYFEAKMDTKICSNPDCVYKGQPQPVNNFWKNSMGKGGFHSVCKSCQNLHRRRRYHQDSEFKTAVANYNKEYRETEHGKTIQKKSFNAYVQRYPEKKKAQRSVNSRVRRGKLPHPSTLPCAHCGKQANQYHHHNGYDKEHRLDVIPVCSACHYLLHLKTT